MNPIPNIMLQHQTTKIVYIRLAQLIDELPGAVWEEKKTCLHVVAGRAAFLGVHPRAGGLRITIPLNRMLGGPRIVKCEQASKNVFHNDVNLTSPADIDPELIGWVKEAYELKKSPPAKVEKVES